MKNKKNKALKKREVSPIELHLKHAEKRDNLRAKIEQIDSKISYLLQQRAELLADL